MPNPVRKTTQSIFHAQLVREAVSERIFDDFGRFWIDPPSLRSLESTAPASKNKGSALRAASQVAHSMQRPKTPKVGRKMSISAPF